MRMCSECWSKLRTAIDSRGLGGFVMKSGEAIVAKMMAPKNESEAFEPLFGAHNALVANALQAGGIGLMAGDGCPLCTLAGLCQCGLGDQCAYRTWIDRAADDQLARARKLGLVS